MRLFAVAVAATGVFGLAALLIARGAPAANPIDGHPAPVLFDAVRIAPLGAQLAAEKPIADRLFRDWAGQHPGRDDAAFTRFAIAQLPGPPDSATQAGELTELRALAAERTKQGKQAANWLGVYLCKAIAAPLRTLEATVGDAISQLKHGDTSGLERANAAVAAIEGQAKSAGLSLPEDANANVG